MKCISVKLFITTIFLLITTPLNKSNSLNNCTTKRYLVTVKELVGHVVILHFDIVIKMLELRKNNVIPSKLIQEKLCTSKHFVKYQSDVLCSFNLMVLLMPLLPLKTALNIFRNTSLWNHHRKSKTSNR